MANYTIQEKFIGSGYAFPIVLESGKPKLLVGNVELIRSSLRILLQWPTATRFFLAEFGCRLEDLIGQPNDDILQPLVFQFITESIYKFEKRIELLDSKIERVSPTKINITLTYNIRRTSLQDSFILPFYKKPIY